MEAGDAARPRRRRSGGDGWERLTGSERVIVGLVVRGLSNPQIAHELTVSVNTVKSHLKSIFKKAGVSTRSELAAHAVVRARNAAANDAPLGRNEPPDHPGG